MAASGRTLTVDDDDTADYSTIQAAIDYIATTDDPTGWTIEVKNGTYDRFTVPHWNKSGISDLTIVGESEDDVIINVLNEPYTESALIDNGGINIYGTNVTLKNMTIQAGTVKQAWDDAAISTNHGMSGGKDVSLTVENCTLIGPGIGNGATYGIFWACSGMNVINCNISGFANAIEYMNDGFNVPSGETYYITNNVITGSSFAIHGYMGGGNGGGTLRIANNVVTGTDNLRSKVICQDNAADSFVVDIRNNTLTHAMVGLVNLQDDGDVLYDVLDSNIFGDDSYYVEAVEPGRIDFYSTYKAPDGAVGAWEFIGLDYNTYESWCKGQLKANYKTVHGSDDQFIGSDDKFSNDLFNPVFEEYFEKIASAIKESFDKFETTVKSAIDAANENNSNTLSISTMTSTIISKAVSETGETVVAKLVEEWEFLVPTFTWFKDGIYWVGENDKTSYPGLEKWINIGDTDDDGEDEWVESDTIAAGDVVNFVLVSNVPEDLTNYLEAGDVEGPTTYGFDSALNGGTYLLTFHDEMDPNLVFNANSVVVTINESVVDSSLYGVLVGNDIEDDCTFEVAMNLVPLYNAGYFTEDDFGTASIVVTYSATASANLAPGKYLNTAWVEYEGGDTEKDTVTVETYGIKIFKYDQATNEGLYNATFELYAADVCVGMNNWPSEYLHAILDENMNGPDEWIALNKGKLVATLTSGADGYVELDGLDAGYYFLYETKAPSGYVKSDDYVLIEIPDDANAANIVNVKFANAEIPHTGGSGTVMYTVGGIAVLAAAAILFVISRKKKTNQ